MDITETSDLGSLHVNARAPVSFPQKLSKKDEVGALAKNLSKAELQTNLEKLSSFHTRYYKSEYGLQSSDWVQEKVNQIIKDAGAEDTVFVEGFPHSWQQHSVIATIPGQSNSTVVIGAHQDSVNLWLPSVLAAPGADDDGSGSVTILEVFRTLLQSEDVVKGKASNTIEFHWYSAEEGGLLGSQAIFKSYEEAGRDVKAMLQQDMTGYVQKTLDAGQPESVGVITDFVDPGLTAFIKTVIEGVRQFSLQCLTFNLTLLLVLQHPLGRDQVRLCLLRPCLRFQGRISLRVRHRVRLRVLRQSHPRHRRPHQISLLRSHPRARPHDPRPGLRAGLLRLLFQERGAAK